MLEQYLIVSKESLPDYFSRVVEAKALLASGRAHDVAAAAAAAGISRSTFYKYRDHVFEPSQLAEGRRAVLSMVLAHEPGVLAALLARVSGLGANVLTITQSLPVRHTAGVTLSLDVSDLPGSMSDLLVALEAAPGVSQVRLVAVE